VIGQTGIGEHALGERSWYRFPECNFPIQQHFPKKVFGNLTKTQSLNILGKMFLEKPYISNLRKNLFVKNSLR